jgi:D-methionine transport system ATP-binding protein
MTGTTVAQAAVSSTTTAGAAISLEGVGNAFAGPGGSLVSALDNVTLTVEPGAICGIIGRPRAMG